MGLKDLRKTLEKVKKDHIGLIAEANRNALIHKITFDSPQLTYMMSGFSVDRVHQIWGPESAGKSSLCTYIAAQLQKKLPEAIEKWSDEMDANGSTFCGMNGEEFRKRFAEKQVVVYLDFERTFDPDHAEQMALNMDEDHFLLLQPDTLEEGAQVTADLIKSGCVCCVILDSDAMANTKLDLESDVGDTGFNGAKGANVLKAVLKLFNNLCSKNLTPFIEISQERANMQLMSHLPAVTGGNAIKFTASTRQRITKLEQLKDKDGNDCGIQIRVRNYKNKTGIPWRDAIMNMYFNGGFKPDDEYFDFLVKLNFVEKCPGGVYKATWLPKKSEKDELGSIRGEANLKEWITAPEQKELYDGFKTQIMEKLLTNNELDSDNVAVDENADFEGQVVDKVAMKKEQEEFEKENPPIIDLN